MTTLEQDAPLLILWCACWGKAAMIRSRPMFPGTENMKAATSKAYSFMATIYGVPLKAVSGNSSPKKLLKKLRSQNYGKWKDSRGYPLLIPTTNPRMIWRLQLRTMAWTGGGWKVKPWTAPEASRCWSDIGLSTEVDV